MLKGMEKEKYLKERREKIKDEYPYPKMISFENKNKYGGMVIIKNIDFTTKCEHHLIAIKGKVHLAYIPNEKELIGLSQFARVVEYFLNPTTEITQEEVNQKIINFINNKIKPKGIIIVIEAEHDCMRIRGVKQRNSSVITSEIRGCFNQDKVKEEFFKLMEMVK